jgi:hypothetical protein
MVSLARHRDIIGRTLNFLFAILNPCEAAANLFFSSSVVFTAPVVILHSIQLVSRIPHITKKGVKTHSSPNIKLNKPVKIVATLHAAFHDEG